MGFLDLRVKKKYPVFLLCIVILSALLFPVHVFTIMDEKTGRRIHSERVSSGDRFEIHYIHSVEHMNVIGVFSINDQYKIEPLETIFPSYGAGMPFLSRDEAPVGEKGNMIIKHQGIELQDLKIFISEITKQKIIFKDSRVFLYKRIQDGGIAALAVRRTPLLLTLL